MSADRSLYPSFAALGDSFTEGLDDPCPGGGYRGWADRVAGHLAELVGANFRYANLAVRGRRLPQIVAEQVPAAVTLRPALVSLSGGTNDALRRHFDGTALHASLRAGVEQLSANGSRVLLFTGNNPTRRLPAIRTLIPRIAALNSAARAVAAEYDCVLVDLWPAAEVFDHPAMWSEDRLHLSSAGHERVAGAVLAALGLRSNEDWLAPPGSVAPPSWRRARAADARWVRSYAGPWLRRRVTGRSSGDTVQPKRPALDPYA